MNATPGAPPRRAGWVRIALFFGIGAAFAYAGEYVVAALCAAVGSAVWLFDARIARRPPGD
jgi:hypothetical protein